MKKKIVFIVLLVMCLCLTGCGNMKDLTKDYTVDDAKGLISKIYEQVGEDNLPATETMEINIEDLEMLQYYTGLSSNKDIKFVVASDSMIGSQAYSVVLVKAKDISKVDGLRKEIFDKVNPSKWICVTAEKLYVNNYGSVIAIIMADKDWADPIYKEFTNIAKDNLGNKLEKENEI